MLAWQLNFYDVYAGYLQYRENAGLFPKIIVCRFLEIPENRKAALK